MARIRTIKPEFWSSPDTAKLDDPWGRLLYIAMWNWADDNGRGTANPKELAGFAFPNDDKIDATDIRRMLGGIRRAFGVILYEVAGRPYYAIPSWDQHQKIDKRSAGRHPAPEDGASWDPEPPQGGDQHKSEEKAEHSEEPAEVTPNTRGTPGVGSWKLEVGSWNKNPPTSDQGEHQTRTCEREESPPRPKGSRAITEALNATAHSAEARGILRKWTEDHDEPLPPTIYIQLARQIDTLRGRGATGAYVWAALLEWDEKRQIGDQPKPGLLPYLHDQIKLDGLTASQLYATPVEYLRDEDIDVFEVLGYDGHPPEAPDAIENGPFDARHDWYAAAIKQRHHERCIQAREVITRRQAMRQTARESA